VTKNIPRQAQQGMVKGTKNDIGHMGKDIKHAKNIDHTMKVDSCMKKNDKLVNTKEIQIFS
jgi:hypothetical protein